MGIAPVTLMVPVTVASLPAGLKAASREILLEFEPRLGGARSGTKTLSREFDIA
jgi:hypothetical protein